MLEGVAAKIENDVGSQQPSLIAPIHRERKSRQSLVHLVQFLFQSRQLGENSLLATREP